MLYFTELAVEVGGKEGLRHRQEPLRKGTQRSISEADGSRAQVL